MELALVGRLPSFVPGNGEIYQPVFPMV